MLIPIGHENMSARRWPLVTIGLIAINAIVFLLSFSNIEDLARQAATVKQHMLQMVATHPDMQVPEQDRAWINAYMEHHTVPTLGQGALDPVLSIAGDPWAARVRKMSTPEECQAEMDALVAEYAEIKDSSVIEKYAFIPAKPRPVSYLTANFLHGGWLHLIFNMWFLWLAGFVLEDAWGRTIYTIFYLVAGVAALLVHAASSPGSLAPTIGASGAVAGLMGAFLARFPKMKIEMMWLMRFRTYRFRAAAYWLLPLWLLMELFYASLSGEGGGVAHWAHIGGFAFGAVAAMGLRYSGLEHKANAAIEEKITWNSDPEIEQATDLMEKGQWEEAGVVVNNYLALHPDSIDGWNLMQQIHWRQSQVPEYQAATIRLCELQLKNRHPEAAWQSYEDLLKTGTRTLPVTVWYYLARAAESVNTPETALAEYQKLSAAYPDQKQALMANMAAARISLRVNDPQTALRCYEAASASPVPHLDLEQTIDAGIRQARRAISAAPVK